MIVASILSNGNAATIRDAIRSVLPLVDRVLLVDTGITDNTLAVAAAEAGNKLIVERFAWCNDFSAARNYCLDAVRRHNGIWYLMVDSDEVFSIPNPQLIRDVLQAAPEILCWLVAHDGDYVKEKLIRVSSAARWFGRTHEALLGLPQSQKRILPGVAVSSRFKTAVEFHAKLLRDRDALKLETRDYPTDPRWWYYLGQTQEGLREFAEAITAYMTAAVLPGWDEQAAWACYCAARCHAELSDMAGCVRTCALGLTKHAHFPELVWLAGWGSYQIGRYADAIAWAEMALAIRGLGECDKRIGFRYLRGWDEGPREVIRFARERLA
jgi:tetratricopeptide (TPR) repeat protein